MENLEHAEMVPEGQSVSNWTEMVTVQVFHGGVPQKTPAAFADWLSSQWKGSCPGAKTKLMEAGEAGGYPYAFWWMGCPKSPATDKPEHTIAIAIGGRDSFYVVQKAWAFEPEQADVTKWNRDFFSHVRVCDNRNPQARCPGAARLDTRPLPGGRLP